MVKKHTSIISSIVVAITIGMSLLYLYSPLTAEVYRGNFSRNFTDNIKLEKKYEIDLRHNSFYIAGIDSETVYLGNYTRPFLLTTVNKATKAIKKIQIKVSKLDSVRDPNYFKTFVTSKYFYLAHGVIPVILRGETGTWKATPIKIQKNDYFDQIIPINTNSFALRFYNGMISGYSIGKKNTGLNSSFSFDTTLLQKQGEGIFSVDGTLHFSKKLNKIIYLYSYRNEFIVSDTNLNLEYRSNTIDTFKIANMKIANVSDSRKMLASSGSVINKSSCVHENILYVESNVLSKNEPKDKFLTSSVIDAYLLDDHSYLYSFYIDEKNKLTQFKVYNNEIFTISGDKLIILDIVYKHPNTSKTLPVRPQG